MSVRWRRCAVFVSHTYGCTQVRIHHQTTRPVAYIDRQTPCAMTGERERERATMNPNAACTRIFAVQRNRHCGEIKNPRSFRCSSLHWMSNNAGEWGERWKLQNIFSLFTSRPKAIDIVTKPNGSVLTLITYIIYKSILYIYCVNTHISYLPRVDRQCTRGCHKHHMYFHTITIHIIQFKNNYFCFGDFDVARRARRRGDERERGEMVCQPWSRHTCTTFVRSRNIYYGV